MYNGEWTNFLEEEGGELGPDGLMHCGVIH